VHKLPLCIMLRNGGYTDSFPAAGPPYSRREVISLRVKAPLRMGAEKVMQIKEGFKIKLQGEDES
jgi:hypothetical protein